MTQNIFIKKIVNIIAVICSLTCLATDTSANNVGITTASVSEKKTLLALHVIEPIMELNKRMIKSVKLDAFDNRYGRVDFTLTTDASKQFYSIGKLKKKQKMIFTINNEISEALMVLDAGNNTLLLSISTSRKNADLIMKIFS